MRIRAAKPKLIALDSDVANLERIAQIARPYYQVIPTRDARWATGWLAQYRDVSVFVAAHSLAGGEGLPLMQAARNMRPDVLTILMMRDGDSPQSLDAGNAINHVLEKPFSAEALLDLICPEKTGTCVSPHRAMKILNRGI